MTNEVSTYQILEPGFLPVPEQNGEMPPSSLAEMDSAGMVLNAYKDEWVRMPARKKVAILERVGVDTHALCEGWQTAGVLAKNTRGNALGEAEEWAMYTQVLRLIGLLSNALRDIEQFNRPQIPGPVSTRSDGQVTAGVYPIRRFDRLFLQGTTAEVWMQPGVTSEDVYAGQARIYREGAVHGRVCLVLGTGNSAMGVPADLLYKLFVEGQVVIVKMSPVNDYMGPIYGKAFGELITRGFLRIVYGDPAEGSYLCHHPGVDELHMTGSNKTYEAIVYGPSEEGARRKAERRRISLAIWSRLSISPIIHCGATWRRP